VTKSNNGATIDQKSKIKLHGIEQILKKFVLLVGNSTLVQQAMAASQAPLLASNRMMKLMIRACITSK
jgi:hypothetical protein